MTPAAKEVHPQFVLDSNAFIQAHRAYYAFDIAPGYWAGLLQHHAAGNLISIDRVRGELLSGGKADALETWVKSVAPKTMFASTKTIDVAVVFGELVRWVQAEAKFKDEAKAEFAVKADAWLIAYAKLHGMTIVSFEHYDANMRKKVLIPVICKQFGVECIDTFEMLRRLKMQFN